MILIDLMCYDFEVTIYEFEMTKQEFDVTYCELEMTTDEFCVEMVQFMARAGFDVIVGRHSYSVVVSISV